MVKEGGGGGGGGVGGEAPPLFHISSILWLLYGYCIVASILQLSEIRSS